MADAPPSGTPSPGTPSPGDGSAGTLLAPVHPLENRRPAFAVTSAELEPGLWIELEPDVATLDVRVDPAHREVAARVLGVELPDLGTWCETADGRALRLGPDQWLLTSTTADAPTWEAGAIEALRPLGGTTTDVSAQRTGVRLGGDRARELLASGCALDLRARRFPAGSCAQTLFGQVGVLLAADTADLTVLTRTSFAGYLADRLLDAAEGLRPATDPPPRRETP